MMLVLIARSGKEKGNLPVIAVVLCMKYGQIILYLPSIILKLQRNIYSESHITEMRHQSLLSQYCQTLCTACYESFKIRYIYIIHSLLSIYFYLTSAADSFSYAFILLLLLFIMFYYLGSLL